MTDAFRPWRPPLFDLLGTAAERRALGIAAPTREAAGYLRAFLRQPDRWSYAVIDEMVDETVGLVISPWPVLDDLGRLRGPSEAVSGNVDLGDLQAFIDAHRERAREVKLLEARHVGRALRIGDAFAVGVGPRRGRLRLVTDDGVEVQVGGVPGPKDSRLRDGVVLDLTFDAREASRVAYYAAMAPELDATRDADIITGSALSGVERAMRSR